MIHAGTRPIYLGIFTECGIFLGLPFDCVGDSIELMYQSSTSSGSIPAGFGSDRPATVSDDEQEDIVQLYETVTRSITVDHDNNVLTRLSTLTHTLSHLSHAAMQSFVIDPNDFDLKRVLDFIADRNVEQGLNQKKTNVVFKDLTVYGKNSAASVVKDVGTIFAPFHKSVQLPQTTKTRQIIRDVAGFALPGTLTLVLGRPGSGCTTFLKTIAGETQTYVGVEGEITYDGIDRKQMVQQFRNQIIYVPELDDHFPYLTVEQTLKFAIGCKTPKVRIDNLSRKDYINTIKDLYTVLFGIKHVEKTLVGNDFVRGISGGQRKRVSIAEAMATRGTVFCYDNATRGLDASTALEFVEALRTSTNIARTTCLVTAYQASESIYELFDMVTILYLGRQVFFGPTDKAVDYFIRLGFQRAPRQTSAEFLTAVTDPDDRSPMPGFEDKVPCTPNEFEQCWRKSPEFAALQEDISHQLSSANALSTSKLFHEVHHQEKQVLSRSNSKYVVNYFEQLRLCCTRSFYNILNNKSYTVTQVSAALLQSFVVGSMYYNTSNSTAGAFSRSGVLFFALLYFLIMTIAEISSLFENKPILNKQRGYTMYHPSADLISNQLIGLQVRFISIFLFSLVLYFLANLKREAGSFFTFLLFVNLGVQATDSIFIFLSSLCPSLSAANGLTGLFMMAAILYSSFMVQRPSMYWWFEWFSYINPVLYGFEAMITTEFHGRMMPCASAQLVPSGSSYENVSLSNQACAIVGSALTLEKYPSAGNSVSGDIYINLSFEYSYSHTWRNMGILFGFIVGIVFLNSLLVEFFNPIEATSDKLLFIRGGQLPEGLIDGDPEKGDLEKERQRNVTSRHISSLLPVKLGSSDIFMWNHINFTVPYEGKQRKLLDDVQGYVLPGTLTALMGESGAGKTTLLNVLSQRTDVGIVAGDFLINGKPLDRSFERRTGYVQQQDLHIAELTVRESLLFAARLRRPARVPDSEKVEYVDRIMSMLDMQDYADAIAGNTGYGLNVEQRKKLSIATELVAKPSLLLFLDEPTSGLDSQSAWAIVKILRQLAGAGQAILCTIHQPSATLFEQFDRLLLLQRGGQTTYFGDIGKSSKTVIRYFESHGARGCLSKENPAEYILDVIGAGATASSEKDWAKVWLESDEYIQAAQEIEQLIESTSSKNVAKSSEDASELQNTFATSYSFQFLQVLLRTWTQLYRDMDYIKSKLMLMVIAGLMHGFTFWDVKETAIGMQNTLFASFIAMIMSAPLINQIQSRAIQSRELFEVRESKSNTFHWSALLLSQFLVEVPYSVLFSTFYFIAFYFPIQLPLKASVCGFWWFTYCIFFQLYYLSFGLTVVYFSPDLPSANVMTAMLLNFVISFCGVVQPPSLLPGFWKFMWRLSPLTYFVENMVATTLHDRPVHCSAKELNYLKPPEGMTCGEYLKPFFESNDGYVANPEAVSKCGICKFSVGDQYLSTLGMSFYHRWRNIGLFCVYIVFNLACLLGIYYLLRVRGLDLPKFKLFKKGKDEKDDEDKEN
ncbi:DEKNAAC104080 [Brettanomyces naardenensis]|uniref:DEKNAAC104081 n=1 Tax=Brettanomyces naardenensis TaxID=13370 RepID=A0A448YQ29_BRENA|nr:DEKNAAC104080 [Brettanomyces naardenensis]